MLNKVHIFFNICYMFILKIFKMKSFKIHFFQVKARDNFKIRIISNGILNIKGHCFFNSYCSINVMKYVEIGDHCIFGENVKIYDHNHVFNIANKLISQSGYSCKEIIIGDNCWIGSNVTILAGAKIGNNCVIGANVVISKSIPNNTIIKNNNAYTVENIKYTKGFNDNGRN